jgi:glycosyltransferase involved in cell wall biosynthesis
MAHPVRLLYIADAALPASSANTLQIARMCSAFADEGAAVTLLARPRGVAAGRGTDPGQWPTGLAAHYGIEPSFALARPRRLWPGRSRRDVWNGVYSVSALLWAWRRRHSFDVIYTRLPLLAALAAERGLPVVYEAHRLLPAGSRRVARRAAAVVAASMLPAFIGTVAISDCLRRLCIEEGFAEGKMLVEHDAVDLERFAAPLNRSEARAALRAAGLQLADDEKVVGYSGHFYRGRGIPELLQCAAARPDWAFLFVGGNKSDLAQYIAAAQQAALHNVRFVGFLPNAQLPPYLYACDVLAMPYSAETGSAQFMSPMKMFEYLAAGRVIVATDWPPLREVLHHESNALLVPPGDNAALQAALGRVLDGDGALRERLQQQARRDAAHYSWRHRAQRILAWIRQSLPEV